MRGNSTIATVDEYIVAQAPLAQARLREIREAIRRAVPQASESISYGMPTYRVGRQRVHFGAAKRHCALYGSATDAYADQLRGYKVLKGTVQFPLREPIPEELVQNLVRGKLLGD